MEQSEFETLITKLTMNHSPEALECASLSICYAKAEDTVKGLPMEASMIMHEVTLQKIITFYCNYRNVTMSNVQAAIIDIHKMEQTMVELCNLDHGSVDSKEIAKITQALYRKTR